MPHPFRVERVAGYDLPQQTTYIALHCDYSEDYAPSTSLPEDRCGDIAVSRLLKGNKGHYGCYSADTSVMTDRGWVLWPDVTESDLLLAVDPSTGHARFELPKQLIRQAVVKGDLLYHASSQRIDLLVTHDHRMVISRRTSRGGEMGWTDWRVEPASKVASTAVRYRVTAELDELERQVPADIPADVFAVDALRVAGFYFGDGVRSRSINPASLRFSLRRPRKIEYLQEVGSKVGLVTANAHDRWSLKCGELAAWVEKHFKNEHGKTIPRWLLLLPRAEFLAFLDGLRHSDGTKFKETTLHGGSSWSLDSSEKEALELIQAAAAINGIGANFYLNNPNEGPGHENHRPCWRITFMHTRDYARFEANQNRTRGSEGAVAYEGDVYCATVSTGALLVRRNGKPVVSGNCLEHSHLTLAIKADHNTMMQLRTHRVGLSFDFQSMRYSGERVIKCAAGKLPVEDVFYIRPAGKYRDRQGDPYIWSEEDIDECRAIALSSAHDYARLREKGCSEEHARHYLITTYFQNGVVTGNIRSWMHLLDVRLKADAQLEIRILMEMIAAQLQRWVPEIYAWWQENRRGKGLLAP